MGVKRAPIPLTDTDIPAAITRDTEVTAAINAHVAAADPHPVYLTQTEGDGRYRQSATALSDADIPVAIARDAEVTAAINAHVAAVDPHAQYLLQSEGDARYRQTATTLTDADIPAAIARDTEVTAAINAHVAAADPHPNLWTRITNAFLALTGGQVIIKNNPAMSPVSYSTGQNHLELRTNDGSNPILGFHRAGFSATALYHLGYGNNSLRIRNADGFDGAILHDGNCGVRHAVIYATLPASGPTIIGNIALPAGVTADKIIAIGAVAKMSDSNGTLISPAGLAWADGYKFSVDVSAGVLRVGVGAAGASGSVFGGSVRIVISYLP
jgi:predicted FMN-binding regulatory protein PaiB